MMAGLFVLNGMHDVLLQFCVRCAGCHASVEVVVDLREETGWCRLSVGATTVEEIEAVLPNVRAAIEALK